MSTTHYPNISTLKLRTGSNYYLPSPMLRPSGEPAPMNTKFILVTGGVCSSLGKGVTSSSVGALLRAEGFRVCSIKIDPYINVDAGLMSPFEHGEVYVLKDGGEVDLDLGNYERWLSVQLSRDHNITTGKVYNTLITRERRGEYLGKTVQVVPHFTNEVVEHILRVSQTPVDGSGLKPQICMIELGGTVGDLESAPFVEALRTLRFVQRPEDFCLIHCTYLPVMGGGQKTKPSQHSCRTLLSAGLTADFLVCRSDHILATDARKKLSQQCGVAESDIIGAHNVPSIYQVPVEFHRQGMVDRLLHKLRLDRSTVVPLLDGPTVPDVNTFARFANILQNSSNQVVRIAFVGKYVTGGSDAYFSVLQTFEHCCLALEVRLDIVYIDSSLLEGDAGSDGRAMLLKCDGIFVPGGFGSRGIDGKVNAAKIARENNIPYFGVCLGMQIALIEQARNLLGHQDANSAEFDKDTTNPVVRIMDCDHTTMGANMHLGLRNVHLIEPNSIMSTIYGKASCVAERHRHRYEFNMNYCAALQAKGIKFTGVSDPSMGPNCRVEAIEIPAHRFFLAVQYHPEFVTTPVDPSPPFLAFIAAAANKPFAWPTGNSRAVNGTA